MKKFLFTLLLPVLALTAAAQTQRWAEMDAFHNVMSETFHPSEEDNLKPLRDSASVLVKKAKAWQASAVPLGYNAKATKPTLAALVTQCAAIEKSVRAKASNASLKAQISAAHDTFHEIMEKCRKEE